MSIASRVNREFHDDDYDKGLILMEANVVEHSVSTIVAGRPDVARELAAVLLRVERGLNSPTRSSSVATLKTIELLVELAYLESHEYDVSLDHWRRDLLGEIPPSGDDASEDSAQDG
jgi:hypothetical protein